MDVNRRDFMKIGLGAALLSPKELLEYTFELYKASHKSMVLEEFYCDRELITLPNSEGIVIYIDQIGDFYVHLRTDYPQPESDKVIGEPRLNIFSERECFHYTTDGYLVELFLDNNVVKPDSGRVYVGGFDIFKHMTKTIRPPIGEISDKVCDAIYHLSDRALNMVAEHYGIDPIPLKTAREPKIKNGLDKQIYHRLSSVQF